MTHPRLPDLVAALRAALDQAGAARDSSLAARERFTAAQGALQGIWDGSGRQEPQRVLAALAQAAEHLERAAAGIHSCRSLMDGYVAGTLGFRERPGGGNGPTGGNDPTAT